MRAKTRTRVNKEESEMKHTTIGVDLAKSVFEVGISESPGSVKVHR